MAGRSLSAVTVVNRLRKDVPFRHTTVGNGRQHSAIYKFWTNEYVLLQSFSRVSVGVYFNVLLRKSEGLDHRVM
jgi:hypothetical protein